MLIASLRQTSPGRLTVALEDGTEIRSTLGVVTDLRLYTGRDLDEERLAELKKNSRRAIARERALEILSRRQMSRKELRDKLLQKGEDEDTAKYCVRWLSDQGFLDDGRYAAAVTRHYAGKGYGPGRVRMELSRRGIPRELWEDALETMPETESKIDKYIASRLRDPGDRDEIRKISAALYRRGHSWEEIRAALRRCSAETEDD